MLIGCIDAVDRIYGVIADQRLMLDGHYTSKSMIRCISGGYGSEIPKLERRNWR